MYLQSLDCHKPRYKYMISRSLLLHYLNSNKNQQINHQNESEKQMQKYIQERASNAIANSIASIQRSGGATPVRGIGTAPPPVSSLSVESTMIEAIDARVRDDESGRGRGAIRGAGSRCRDTRPSILHGTWCRVPQRTDVRNEHQ